MSGVEKASDRRLRRALEVWDSVAAAGWRHTRTDGLDRPVIQSVRVRNRPFDHRRWPCGPGRQRTGVSDWV